MVEDPYPLSPRLALLRAILVKSSPAKASPRALRRFCEPTIRVEPDPREMADPVRDAGLAAELAGLAAATIAATAQAAATAAVRPRHRDARESVN